MSWSVTFIGKSDKVVEALQKNLEKLHSPTKEEYEAALPHMVELVSQNFENGNPIDMKIEAGGSAYIKDDKKESSSFWMKLERVWGLV